jgi:hypothetical protein
MKKAFYKTLVGDVEDPDWYANIEIGDWATKNTEAYQFLLEHSNGNVRIERQAHEPIMGHSYSFTAEMDEKDWFMYTMRFE